MTIPYIPGPGDYLKADLPQLGQNLESIINPHRKLQGDLAEMISRRPELLDELTAQEQSNPGALGKIFGPKVSSYFSQRQLTPSYQAKVGEQQATVERTKAETSHTTQLAAQAKEFTDKLRRENEQDVEDKKLMSEAATNPDLKDLIPHYQVLGAIRRQTGIDPTLEDNRENVIALANERKRLAEVAKNSSNLKDANTAYEKFSSGQLSQDEYNALGLPSFAGMKKFIDDKYVMDKQAQAAKDAVDRQSARDEASMNRLLTRQQGEAKTRMVKENEAYSRYVQANLNQVNTGRKGKPLKADAFPNMVSQLNADLDRINVNNVTLGNNEPPRKAFVIDNNTKSFFGLKSNAGIVIARQNPQTGKWEVDPTYSKDMLGTAAPVPQAGKPATIPTAAKTTLSKADWQKQAAAIRANPNDLRVKGKTVEQLIGLEPNE